MVSKLYPESVDQAFQSCAPRASTTQTIHSVETSTVPRTVLRSPFVAQNISRTLRPCLLLRWPPTCSLMLCWLDNMDHAIYVQEIIKGAGLTDVLLLTLVSAVLLMPTRSLSAVWESREQLVFLIDCRLTAESGQ